MVGMSLLTARCCATRKGNTGSGEELVWHAADGDDTAGGQQAAPPMKFEKFTKHLDLFKLGKKRVDEFW
jgi:hypothetical protein